MVTTLTRDLIGMPAASLVQLIAAGELSSAEVVEAHIERIEAVNPALNAVVVKRFAEARAEAHAADQRRSRGEPLGPLHGVPVTVKEALDLAGTPSTAGLTARAHRRMPSDAPSVAALRAAGAIVLGKTNVAQLLLAFESDNPVYGKTSNPWNPGRTAGGSSGGEAAIIAAGGVPLGLGTDIAGSVRIPAAFSGIVGFKPTNGRVPDSGTLSVPLGQQAIPSQVGVLARTVGDVALGMNVLNGAGSEFVVPLAAINPEHDLVGLRVAVYTDDGTFTVAPAVRRAVQEAAELLRARGARVSSWAPPNVPEAFALWFGLTTADGARGLRRLVGRDPLVPSLRTLLQRMGTPRPLARLLDAALRASGQASSTMILRHVGHHDTDHYWRLVAAQQSYRERFRSALDEAPGGPFDLILAPGAALPALPHGAGGGPVGTLGAYTLLYNLLGYPAGVVPVTRVQPGEESERAGGRDLVEQAAREIERGSAGLPIGVQVVARPWQDHLALATMAAIEAQASRRATYPHLAELPLHG
jgi:fatty acid amide hydrolase